MYIERGGKIGGQRERWIVTKIKLDNFYKMDNNNKFAAYKVVFKLINYLFK